MHLSLLWEMAIHLKTFSLHHDLTVALLVISTKQVNI